LIENEQELRSLTTTINAKPIGWQWLLDYWYTDVERWTEEDLSYAILFYFVVLFVVGGIKTRFRFGPKSKRDEFRQQTIEIASIRKPKLYCFEKTERSHCVFLFAIVFLDELVESIENSMEDDAQKSKNQSISDNNNNNNNNSSGNNNDSKPYII
jgi:hypothetical protein